MLMKKQLLFLLRFILISCHISKAQDSSFTINGKLEKVKNGTIYLNIYEGDKTIIDSATLQRKF